MPKVDNQLNQSSLATLITFAVALEEGTRIGSHLNMMRPFAGTQLWEGRSPEAKRSSV